MKATSLWGHEPGNPFADSADVHPPQVDPETDPLDPSAAPRSKADEWVERLKQITLGQFLRLIGTVLILASATIFLVQQWSSADHVERYLLLLGQTILVAGGGLFCGLTVKEARGARTFFAVALAMMPAQFGVMAGLLFSRFSLDVALFEVPSVVSWIAPSDGAALALLGATLAILSPVSYFAFRALARERATALTGIFLALNSLLLIPTRSSEVMAVLIIAGVALTLWLELKIWIKDSVFKSNEGRLARLMVLSPVALLILRSTTLYSTSALLFSALSATLAGLMVVWSTRLSEDWQAPFMRVASLGPALISTSLISYTLGTNSIVAGEGFVLTIVAPVVVFTHLLSRLAPSGKAGLYRAVAILMSLTAVSFNMAVFPGTITALFALVVALAGVALSLLDRLKLMGLLSSLVAVCSLGFHLWSSIREYSLLGWGSLVVLGALIIVAASILERHQERLNSVLSGARQKWDDHLASSLD